VTASGHECRQDSSPPAPACAYPPFLYLDTPVKQEEERERSAREQGVGRIGARSHGPLNDVEVVPDSGSEGETAGEEEEMSELSDSDADSPVGSDDFDGIECSSGSDEEGMVVDLVASPSARSAGRTRSTAAAAAPLPLSHAPASGGPSQQQQQRRRRRQGELQAGSSSTPASTSAAAAPQGGLAAAAQPTINSFFTRMPPGVPSTTLERDPPASQRPLKPPPSTSQCGRPPTEEELALDLLDYANLTVFGNRCFRCNVLGCLGGWGGGGGTGKRELGCLQVCCLVVQQPNCISKQ
jgi:hypothetical protein